MNKGFDELMYDAGLTAQGCWDQLDPYDREAIMRFGKLIVRECLSYTEEGDLDFMKFMIKKNFGVE